MYFLFWTGFISVITCLLSFNLWLYEIYVQELLWVRGNGTIVEVNNQTYEVIYDVYNVKHRVNLSIDNHKYGLNQTVPIYYDPYEPGSVAFNVEKSGVKNLLLIFFSFFALLSTTTFIAIYRYERNKIIRNYHF